VLLDQSNEKNKKIVVSGNNQLLKGAVFAVVSLVWFCFLFAYMDMDWQRFSPFIPFAFPTHKDDYIFYFVCFSFFITTLIFSTIFYRNNLQPTDLLLRFGVILLMFAVLFMLHLLAQVVLYPYKTILLNSIGDLTHSVSLLGIVHVLLTFILLYFIFFPVILFCSKIFFNGFFGMAGYFLSFIITAIYFTALCFLYGMEDKLAQTRYPLDDLAIILFFTLVSFGVGISSGDEEKKKRPTVRLNSNMDKLRGL